MIKVICIDNNNGMHDLTINNIYDAYEFQTFYEVISDKLKMEVYYKDRFIPLADWRDKQINSILDD